MAHDHCDEFEELLVDLADGELPPGQERRVRDHVAQCAGCSELLCRLNESLACTRFVWDDWQRDEPEAIRRQSVASGSDKSQQRADMVTIGIAALIVAATLLLVMLPRIVVRDDESAGVARKEIAAAVNPKPAAVPDVEDEMDIERFLHEQEQAARLAAVVEILKDAPGVADVQARTEEYLQTYYGGQ